MPTSKVTNKQHEKLEEKDLDGTSSTGIAPTSTLVEEPAVQEGERHRQHQDGVVPVVTEDDLRFGYAYSYVSAVGQQRQQQTHE